MLLTVVDQLVLVDQLAIQLFVIPAKAGIQWLNLMRWIPAFAGMTVWVLYGEQFSLVGWALPTITRHKYRCGGQCPPYLTARIGEQMSTLTCHKIQTSENQK